MNDDRTRPGFTLIELIVAISVIAILVALLLPAIQFARTSSRRVACANNLRQVGVALHSFHDANRTFPSGVIGIGAGQHENMTWITQSLPFLENGDLFNASAEAFHQDASPYSAPHAELMEHPLPIVSCPEDPRGRYSQTTRSNRQVGLTSYLGCSGKNSLTASGVFHRDSAVSLAHIIDGSSQTVMVGERPASSDSYYGWWYAGFGQAGTGSLNSVLGTREINLYTDPQSLCYAGPFAFRRGSESDNCARFHFWSLHSGGGFFLFGDSSVRFLSYESDNILPALSTKSDGDVSSQ